MRPVEKGAHPQDQNGNQIVYTQHQEARGELIKRLGQYCSYCEMKLGSGLAVEHIKPKHLYPHYQLLWGNYLLSCPNCNSIKGDKDINDHNINDYVWADRDNSFRAFIYSEGGTVKSAELDESIKVRSRNTINLLGLDKQPLKNSKASDRRWQNRREAWDNAQRSKDKLRTNDSEDMKDLIVTLATATGYWSVWMTVFHDDEDMLRRFIAAYPGTANSCFDTNQGYKPTPRSGGIC